MLYDHFYCIKLVNRGSGNPKRGEGFHSEQMNAAWR